MVKLHRGHDDGQGGRHRPNGRRRRTRRGWPPMSVRFAVHIHSNWSFDGKWPIELIARRLRRLGFGGMLTAEHCQSLDLESWAEYRQLCGQLCQTASSWSWASSIGMPRT